jgi:hypothetical protein
MAVWAAQRDRTSLNFLNFVREGVLTPPSIESGAEGRFRESALNADSARAPQMGSPACLGPAHGHPRLVDPPSDRG